MDTSALISVLGPVLATFVVSLVSAVVPFLYVEVYLVAIVAVVPEGGSTWTLGVVAALGQMAGKSALYWSGRGVTRACAVGNAAGSAVATTGDGRRSDSRRNRGLRQRLATMPPLAVNGLTFTSALLGFPPLILVAPAAGAAAVRFWPFVVAGFAGRVLRFTALVAGTVGVRRLLAGG